MEETTIMTENTEAGVPAPIEAPERHVVFEEALEAILFAAGHPISYASLARVFEMSPTQVKARVATYASAYNTQDLDRGVIMLCYPESCQLCTKEYYLPEIRDCLGIKKSGTLSSAALETLAIVAYNQPVTRIFVDTLRRVDSSYAMNGLIDRGLIESKGRMDVPGRPMLFGTTEDFLRCFGLKTIADLPATTEEIVSMLEKAKKDEEKKFFGDENPDQLTMEDALNELTVAEAKPQETGDDDMLEPSAEDTISE